MPSSRYTLERLVGRGGMGSVYRGVDRDTGTVVALKLVRRAGSDDEPSVMREAGLLARVEHPNVMRLHGVDAHDDGTWLVCEWIEGRTLAELRSKLGPVSAACCAVQIFAAVAAMRGAGIVHRDIKPANLMLTATGHVKLIDFGVAFHPSIGRGDTVAGSPRYMDPRILGGGGADARSDMYGAGLVVAELLLGEPLWPELAPLLLHQFLRREGMARLKRALAFAHPEMRNLIEAAIAPCLMPEAFGAAPEPEATRARLAGLLAAWDVDDPAVFLAAAQETPDGLKDERMAAALRGEAEAKLADGAMKAKERAPWFGYAASLGVAEPAPRRGPRRLGIAAAVAVAASAAAGLWYAGHLPAPHVAVDPTPRVTVSAPSGLGARPPSAAAPAPVESPVFAEKHPDSPPPTPPRRQVATPPAVPKKTVKQAAVRAAPKATKVYLNATAWADVFIDGQSAGRIPRAKPFDLMPGPHQFRLASPVIETLNTTLVIPRETEARFSLSPKKRAF